MNYTNSQNPKLGTAVKITATPEIAGGGSPDSMKITIEDGTGSAKITNADMTNNGDGTYYYIFQSSASHTAGKHTAIITATSGDKTAISEVTFTLEA